MNEEELYSKAVRLVSAWNTKDNDVDELLDTIKANQDFLLKTQYIFEMVFFVFSDVFFVR